MSTAVHSFVGSTSLRVLGIVMLVGMLVMSAQAQPPRFSVPLTVTDGIDSYTLYYGCVPNSNFCVVESDSVWGHAEYMLPPAPPSGVFDARFVWPRSGSNATCFDQGAPCDFRPYTSMTQRDTFRIKAQVGAGATLVVSWPANLATRYVAATIRFIGGSGAVNTDMLTNTSVDITDAGDPAVANIYTNSFSTDVEQTGNDIPVEFALQANYPNPFNPTTSIPFAIARQSRTDIAVYDILGRRVATLLSDMKQPGYYKVTWDGTNGAGLHAASGVYFVRMNATADNGSSFSAIQKLLLMK
jgi:hypothetical protein